MFWEIFVALCNEKGTSPSAVCKEVGLSNATATHWKKGAQPGSYALKKLSDYFGVPVNYFDEKKEAATSPASPVITFTPEEQRIILRYRAVSEEARLIIRKILNIPNGDEELVPVYHAAHSKDGAAEDRIIYRTRAELAALENAPESDVDI